MEDRYNKLRQEIEDNPIIEKVMIDEEFIPPNKSAAFTPYDCVLCVTPEYKNVITSGGVKFEKGNVSEKVKDMIEEVEYDRIVGTTVNETSEPGDFLVYISLETFEEYKSRW